MLGSFDITGNHTDQTVLAMAVQLQKHNPKDVDARRLLERFVVGNDDLLALESHVGKFNIFDALRIADVEIRHSNFLAFLLEPSESHGQGQVFLNAVLMALLKNAPPDFPLSPIDLDGGDLRGVEVKREWNHIDLLITSKEPRFAVVIENKVWSKEHSDQLSVYRKKMREIYPEDVPVLFVYLTPHGADPSEETWIPFAYAEMYRVLKAVRDSHENAIGDEVRVFLDHYLNLLGTRFMNDPKLDELCRRIYRNHRQAIDLIIERGKPELPAIAEVMNALNQDARFEVLYHTSKYVDCLMASWRKWLPQFRADDYYPAGSGFWSSEGKLVCTPLFMGPMSDASKRRQIVERLREESTDLGFKRGRSSDAGEYVRVFTPETILEWNENEEPDPKEIHESVKRKLDGLHSRLEKVAPVLKSFFK